MMLKTTDDIQQGGGMKKTVCGIIGGVACLVSLSALPGFAAELLDVKPNVASGSVSVEVTADIPMTYTYYKVPGEARAVVDIADADPEKVEPLIVVNKGAVSSISVDKAMISSMTVSRLVFNLVSETDIHVVAADDRKKLTVSFGKGGEVVAPSKPVVADLNPPTVAAPVVAPPVTAAKVEVAVAPESAARQEKEEDPLGLDEPQPKAAAPKASAPVSSPLPSAQTAVIVPKLAPVVPEASAPISSEPMVVTGVVVGNKTIDVSGKSAISDYKSMTLNDPARLVIDVPGVKGFSASSFTVKKFGIDKIRVATNGSNVRIVLDSSSSRLPAYKIVKTAKGLQIQF